MATRQVPTHYTAKVRLFLLYAKGEFLNGAARCTLPSVGLPARWLPLLLPTPTVGTPYSPPYHRRTIAVPSPYLGRFMFGFRNEIRTCTRGYTAMVRRRCRVVREVGAE